MKYLDITEADQPTRPKTWEMEMSNLQQQNHRKAIIKQDELNRQATFNPNKQLYPADHFVLVIILRSFALNQEKPRV
jgi:hypothetical protein